jgi:phosphohistidine phosphatase SixA
MKNVIKVWSSVGVYALAGTLAATTLGQNKIEPAVALDALALESPHLPTPYAHLLAQGGEAGESGAPAAPAFQNKLNGAELVRALRGGGYIIFFRHGQTEVDYADQVFARMGHCVTQRPLSERGWQQARAIGKAIQALRIPVGRVIASEYCRAWQTADLAFGRYEKQAGLNFAPAEEYTPAQIAQMKTAITPFLSTPPAPGSNTVLVGHDDVFDAATGIYPEPQGVAYVLKPLGAGKFEILAMIKAEDWDKLPR